MTYFDYVKQGVNQLCAFIIGNAIGYYIRVYFNWPEPTVFQTPESIIGGVLGVVIVFPLIQYYMNKE